MIDCVIYHVLYYVIYFIICCMAHYELYYIMWYLISYVTFFIIYGVVYDVLHYVVFMWFIMWYIMWYVTWYITRWIMWYITWHIMWYIMLYNMTTFKRGKSLTSPDWTRSLIRQATIIPVVVRPLPIWKNSSHSIFCKQVLISTWQLKTQAVLASSPFSSSTMASKSHSLGAFSSTIGIL